jgi:hypothetical protein
MNTHHPADAIGPHHHNPPTIPGLPDSVVTQARSDTSICPATAGRVATWFGWHVFELAGVTVPAVLAATVNTWFAAVTALVAAGWTHHEVQVARRNRAIRAGQAQPLLTTTNREGPDDD